MAAKKKQTTKSVAKKTPVKKTVKPLPKKTAVAKPTRKAKTQPTPEETLPMQSPIPQAVTHSGNSGFKIKKRHIYSILAIIIIIALLYVFRNQFVVATVNGQPLSRSTYNGELERRAGKQAMDALVTKMLIMQEASKKNVTVSDKEINDQLKQDEQILAKQGQTLNTYLASQGISMDDFKDQTKINLLVQKLMGDKIKVTDKEVDDELAKMEQQNQDDTSGTPAPLPSKDQIKQQLEQQKINQEVPTWITNLQKNAKITYFIPQ